MEYRFTNYFANPTDLNAVAHHLPEGSCLMLESDGSLSIEAFEEPSMESSWDFSEPNYSMMGEDIQSIVPDFNNEIPSWVDPTSKTLNSTGIARGVKMSIIDFASKTDPALKNLKYVKGVKIIGRVAGIAAGAVAVGEIIYESELRTSHILDATITGVSFIPGFGWMIGGTYFLADIITKKITGMDIGEHLDSEYNGGVIADW